MDKKKRLWIAPQRVLYLIIFVYACYLTLQGSIHSRLYGTLLLISDVLITVFCELKSAALKRLTLILVLGYLGYALIYIPKAADRIDSFYRAWGKGDFKTIYRDLATSRFRSDFESFEVFKQALAQVEEKGGLYRNKYQGLWMLYVYPQWKMQFFRFQYFVRREKKTCIEHFVIMNEKDKWLMDGYNMICDGSLLVTEGNW